MLQAAPYAILRCCGLPASNRIKATRPCEGNACVQSSSSVTYSIHSVERCQHAVHTKASASQTACQTHHGSTHVIHRAQPASDCFNSQPDAERDSRASSSGERDANDANVSDDVQHSSDGSRDPRRPPDPPPSPGEMLLEKLLAELVTKVALPGTLAVVAAFFLKVDPFGHFDLSYSVASSAVLVSAPLCFANIGLLLGNFAPPIKLYSQEVNSTSESGRQANRQHTDTQQAAIDQAVNASPVMNSAEASDADTQPSQDPSDSATALIFKGYSPKGPGDRLKAALHKYQLKQIGSRKALPLVLEIPLLLSGQFATEMAFRAVGLAYAAGWMTDRLYEAGAQPTAVSSVSSQAVPLLIFVGASFYMGAAATQIINLRGYVESRKAITTEMTSQHSKTLQRQLRTDALNAPSDPAKNKKDKLSSELAILNKFSSNNKYLGLQDFANYTLVSAAAEIASYSLLASLFLGTGNMAASWVAGVLVTGTRAACKSVRKVQLDEHRARMVGELAFRAKTLADRLKAPAAGQLPTGTHSAAVDSESTQDSRGAQQSKPKGRDDESE